MRRLLVKIGAWLAILLGLAMMLQPTAADWLTRQRNSKTAQQFAANTATAADAANTDSASQTAEENRPYPELYAAMQAYNAQIYADGQSGLTDAFAYENPPLDLTDYGYDEEVLAMLWIPRLDLELPVYLGASRENMAKGAALLGQTSMPLGGENSNTVLAAHRGYYGAEMLRNELKIIDPADISSVLIQPGRDLLTLSTCHPYTQNYQRYLVIAERDPDAAVTDKDTDLQESEATWDASPRQVTMETDGTTSIAEVEPQSITPLPQEGSTESEGSAVSNLMIWLENNALWAGFVFIAACVGVLAIWQKHREE